MTKARATEYEDRSDGEEAEPEQRRGEAAIGGDSEGRGPVRIQGIGKYRVITARLGGGCRRCLGSDLG